MQSHTADCAKQISHSEKWNINEIANENKSDFTDYNT